MHAKKEVLRVSLLSPCFQASPSSITLKAVSAALVYIYRHWRFHPCQPWPLPPCTSLPVTEPVGSQAQAAPQKALQLPGNSDKLQTGDKTAADTRKSIFIQDLNEGQRREANGSFYQWFLSPPVLFSWIPNSQCLSSPGKNSLQLESFIRAIETHMEECTWVDSLITPSLNPSVECSGVNQPSFHLGTCCVSIQGCILTI